QRVRVVRRRRISGTHRPSRRRQGSAPRRSTWSQLVGLRAETSPPSCGPRPRVGRPSDPRTGPAGTKVGFAENIRVAVPLMDTPEYVAAAEKATRERNTGYMTVMLEGRYTDEYLAEAGNGSPRFTDEELRTISSPVDFVGINVYKPGWYVEPSDQPPGYHDIPVNASPSEDVPVVARLRPGGAVLGSSADAVDMGCHLYLHHRERLRRLRPGGRRRAGLRRRSCDVPPCLPRAAAAGYGRGGSCRWVLPLECAGQLRVDGWLWDPLRADLC